MSRSVVAAVLAVTLSLTATPAVLAAGSGGGGGITGSAPVESRPKSPEQQAEAAYKKGLKHKNRAWKAQEKAVAAAASKNKKKHAKQEKKAAREYAKAQEQFAAVLQVLPEHYKAANELGYVLRKQGDYKRAIGAYTYALKLHPEFYEAIEYRGEAFIAIGFYDEAREAYMQLFRNKPELAEQLMTAMTSWAEQQTNVGAKKRDFVEWIEQRQSVSSLGGVSESNSSGW